MIKTSVTKAAVAVGILALSSVAGAGVASAAPDLGSAINTTCSYPQLVSALDAQDPQAAAAFNSSPVMRGGLTEFLSAGPARRQEIAEYVAASALFQPYLGTIEQAFNTCNSF
jgi:hemophore-related protein